MSRSNLSQVSEQRFMVREGTGKVFYHPAHWRQLEASGGLGFRPVTPVAARLVPLVAVVIGVALMILWA